MMTPNIQKADIQPLTENTYEMRMGKTLKEGLMILLRNPLIFLLITGIIFTFLFSSVILYLFVSDGFHNVYDMEVSYLRSFLGFLVLLLAAIGSCILGFSYFCIAKEVQLKRAFSFSCLSEFWQQKRQVFLFSVVFTTLICLSLGIGIIPFWKVQQNKIDLVRNGYIQLILNVLSYLFCFYVLFSNSLSPMLILFNGLSWREAMRTSWLLVHKRIFSWLMLYFIGLFPIGFALSALFFVGTTTIITVMGLFLPLPIMTVMLYAAYANIIKNSLIDMEQRISEIGK